MPKSIFLINLYEKLEDANEKTSFTKGEIEYMRSCVYDDYRKYVLHKKVI